MLHLFAALVAAATALLIFAGGLVTSTESGLSVPDWPTTYGWFMFTFPLDKMVGGIFYEHSHRLIASVVGFLILVLAAWLWRRGGARMGAPARLRRAGRGRHTGHSWRHHRALVPPRSVSIAHAGLAQLVFCLTVSIALVTSPGWQTQLARPRRPHPAVDRPGNHGRDVRPDSGRRDDAAYGRGSGDSGLPAGLRPPRAACVERADCHPLRAPGRRGDRGHPRARPRQATCCITIEGNGRCGVRRCCWSRCCWYRSRSAP